MSEMGDFWRDVRESRQQKREDNRSNSTQLLQDAGIDFETKNDGYHLIIIIKPGSKTIDFWPSTGKYTLRGGRSGRGVRSLLRLLNRA